MQLRYIAGLGLQLYNRLCIADYYTNCRLVLFASDQSPVINPQPCRLSLVFNNLVVAATAGAGAAAATDFDSESVSVSESDRPMAQPPSYNIFQLNQSGRIETLLVLYCIAMAL